MNNKLLGALCCVALVAACDGYNSANSYMVMADDLAELKADFNESVDQVRLVFIVGPS